MDTQQVLAELGIEELNSGAYAGGWIETHGSELPSYNPATGELIATIVRANGDDYQKVISNSVETFERWRML
ncbi:MAG: aldehyde dehydrogenase family protein, partial [Acidimicrobiia bacterium]|nr:aldehyde dehydrogenase family protein [Acidimicrobiia bacterium]